MLEPTADREKVSGFVLLVGSGPQVLAAGEDREAAIQQAVKILEEKDTIVFVSKLQSKIGNNLVTKDQLVLTRKFE
jgi:F420-0:gamma-glutamyl ligase